MNDLSHIPRSNFCTFLKNHEDSISRARGDFGLLRGAFWAMFQRNAKPIVLTAQTREALEKAYK